MRFRAFILLPVFALVCWAGVSSFAEVTGSGATVQATTNNNTKCESVQIIAPSANGAVIRVGDSTTSVSVGLPVDKGAGLLITFAHQSSLSSIYFYIANGDKVDFACIN